MSEVTDLDRFREALTKENKTLEDEKVIYNFQRVNPFGFRIIKSDEFSKPNDTRYVVINMYEEVMYDAHGRGFKSEASARKYLFMMTKGLGYKFW